MARISLMLGKNRDMPFVSTGVVPSTTAGTDFEVVCFTVPTLNLAPIPTGAAGDLPINAVQLRSITLQPASTYTGQATNFNTLQFNVRRNLNINTTATATIASGSSVVTPVGGSVMNNIQVGSRIDVGAVGTPETVQVSAVTATTFTATFANTHTFSSTPITLVNSATTPAMLSPVNTTSGTVAITAGVQTITPTSMSNIVPGMSLNIAAGGGTAETVVVTSTTPTSFTATWGFNHNSGTALTSTPLWGPNAYSATTNIIQALSSLPLVPPQVNNILYPGDSLTLQNVHTGTGQATPTFTVVAEYVPAKIGR